MRYDAVPALLRTYLTEHLSGRASYMHHSKAAITLHGRPA